ncbi:MAG TPA: FCD domain-containing protein [Solirubrobacterales bacterium]|nr:FCD domain-containing protein [Solirubrobacterales bacterium]
MTELTQEESGGQELRDLFLQPIPSRNPFEETVARLARAIRLGVVPVGEKFPSERELSESLGVSRTTVREAIRGLEQSGYVATERGRFGGTTVLRQEATTSSSDRKELLGSDLLDTLDLRRALEPGAAALAAERATPAQIDQIHVSLEEQVPPAEYPRANCRFHLLIAQATASEQIIRALSDAELRIMEVFLVAPRLEASVDHSAVQHRAIADAIEVGDADAAYRTMSEHIAASDVIMREMIPLHRSR